MLNNRCQMFHFSLLKPLKKVCARSVQGQEMNSQPQKNLKGIRGASEFETEIV